jgi:hypothetical protein
MEGLKVETLKEDDLTYKQQRMVLSNKVYLIIERLNKECGIHRDQIAKIIDMESSYSLKRRTRGLSQSKVLEIANGLLNPQFTSWLEEHEISTLMQIRQMLSPIKTYEEYEALILNYLTSYFDKAIPLEVLILVNGKYGVAQDVLIEKGINYFHTAKEMCDLGILIHSNGYFSLIFPKLRIWDNKVVQEVIKIILKNNNKLKENYNYLDYQVGYISEDDYHQVYKHLYKAREIFRKAVSNANENGKQEVAVAMAGMMTSLNKELV